MPRSNRGPGCHQGFVAGAFGKPPRGAAADAALAGRAGLRSDGNAGAPPNEAGGGVLPAPSAGVRGGAAGGSLCALPAGGLADEPVVPWAPAGRFQASAVVISSAAGTVRRMRR